MFHVLTLIRFGRFDEVLEVTGRPEQDGSGGLWDFARGFADAERVYRAELEDRPNNGWSLFGLKTALAAQGKASPDVDAEFERSWERSDTWIAASRF